MFWRFGGYANVSTIDSILDKQDVTVEELLDESDLIQELKQQNSKLIEFLREEPVLRKLLDYVIADTSQNGGVGKGKEAEKPDDGGRASTGMSFFAARSRSKSAGKPDMDVETEHERAEAQRKKYAFVACEVLSSEVWSITEALMEQRDHLRRFWQYMHRPAPLDALQAGYFTKVNEALLDKKTEEMLAFFRSLDGVVPAMLQHVDCPMVMDLLLKIISLEKHEGGQGIVDWLHSQDLIPLLLGCLSPDHSSATQTSAGDFLKAIITISANATTSDQSVIGPNELTRQLVSEKSISLLIQDMLRGGNALTVGVGIIIEVIRKNNSDYDLDNQVGPEPRNSDPIYLGALLRQFATHVPDFMHLIRSPSSKRADLKAAFGAKIEPLGFDRFKTCELMAELLHCSNMTLLNERGAEEEVRKRDLERERLKNEHKINTPRAPNSPTREGGNDEFGSSVDSHGFHHAGRPSNDEMNVKPEGLRKLEVQNASDEDGFEKVTAPSADELPDEVTFDDLTDTLDKATHGHFSALEKVDKHSTNDMQGQFPADQAMHVPRPLSPTKKMHPSGLNLYFDPPPTRAVDSPTTAGVTDRIGDLEMEEDTVMTEFGEEEERDLDEDDTSSELEREIARSHDKPPPLFADKSTIPAPAPEPPAPSPPESQPEIQQSVATIQGNEEAPPDNHGQVYEAERDGSPVVGDLLKMQFVEHHVVPTIIDFFFRFPWNNFLHNVVYDVVQQVFNGTLERGYNRVLAFDLFAPLTLQEGQTPEAMGLLSGKDIVDRVLDGQRASDASQSKKGMRLGYMGHLTLIAEEICKFGNRQPPEQLDATVHDRVSRQEWTHYVDGVLTETREKDNAVLGGVRPETAINARNMGMGGGTLQAAFSSNTANTLASAGIGNGAMADDSLDDVDGAGGQAFHTRDDDVRGEFDDGNDDEEMGDDDMLHQRDQLAAFSDDEQAAAAQDPSYLPGSIPTIPPPLNIPPSRARRTLAARLAQKNLDNKAQAQYDPDAVDSAAVETANRLPQNPTNIDTDAVAERELGESGLQITGLRVGGAAAAGSKFSGLFGSDDSSSSGGESDFDEDDAGRDHTLLRAEGDYDDPVSDDFASSSVPTRRSSKRSGKSRRPSTTEAKERAPLDDDDDDDEVDDDDPNSATPTMHSLLPRGSGPVPFALPSASHPDSFLNPPDPSNDALDDDNDSSDDDLVEIRARRTSSSSHLSSGSGA